MTAADQVTRLLALVPYLQARPDVDLAETADVFGISQRQLIADLKVLWYCGLPGGLPDDLIEVDMDGVEESGRIRLSNAEFLSRPMRFTPDEAMSLIVALRAVQELAGPALGGDVASALAKLEAAHAGGTRIGVVVGAGRAEIRERLAQAIEQRRAVRLTYDGATRSQTTRPVVEPARLVVRDGYAYLEAWSTERDAWRTYRVDRIAEVEPTGLACAERGEPPEVAGSWLDSRPEAAAVTLRLSPEARWITEYYPTRAVREVPGGLEADLLVADPGWLRSLLLRLGAAVLAVAPPEAAESARAAAIETLSLYGEPAAPGAEPAFG